MAEADSDLRDQSGEFTETGETASPKSKRVRQVLLLAGVLFVLLGGYWFYQYWTVGRFHESTDDAYIRADAVVVSPKVGGYIEEIFVRENERVEPGDPLFRIDPSNYRAQVEQAQAQIDIARASAAGLQAQIGEQHAAVEQAQANLASARVDLQFALEEEQRYAPLAQSGAVARATYSQRETQAEQARAAVNAAEAQLDAARRRISALRAQVGQAEAQAQGGAAQRSAAGTDLSSTLVRASIAGRVGNRTVQVGQFVQPGTRTMSIVPVDELYVTANFKETQLADIRPHQRATIEVDALGGRELEGRIESFAPGTGAEFSLLPPENATGNFTKIVQRVPVRISIAVPADLQALLVPGLSVVVRVDTRSGSQRSTR